MKTEAKLRDYSKRTLPGKKKAGCRDLMKLLAGTITIALILLIGSSALAMPPYTGEGYGKGAGRFINSYYLANREMLLSRGVNSPGDLLTKNQRFNSAFAKTNISGTLNILAILVDFSDKSSQVAAAYFDTLIYADRVGTVTNYYKEVSYNMLTITTVVLPSDIGWQSAPQPYTYYCNNQNGLGLYPRNAQKLVEDAVDAVNPYVNFSQFDNDSNGFVDGLIVVHSGPGAEFTGQNTDIWSHKWAITPRPRDGVYIYAYSMQPEYWLAPSDMTCGVYCHELGHVFGLPDLYDADYSSEGIGRWSLMASGGWNGSIGNSPAHLDAWSKIELGFVSPTIITGDQIGFSITNAENNPEAYKLWTNGLPGNEYFLVENRQLTAYDNYLPGSGLLIYHIDDSSINNNNEWWPGSGYSSHYKVAIIQADNLWELEHGTDRGDAGDPFPGSTINRTFNAASSPNSNNYAGNPTNISISSISNSSSTMTADIAVGSPQYIDNDKYVIPTKAEIYNNYPNPFNTKTTISFQLYHDSHVKISIYDITGKLVDNLLDSYLLSGYHNIDWGSVNNLNKDLSSGIYLYTISVDNVGAFRKMLYLK